MFRHHRQTSTHIRFPFVSVHDEYAAQYGDPLKATSDYLLCLDCHAPISAHFGHHCGQVPHESILANESGRISKSYLPELPTICPSDLQSQLQGTSSLLNHLTSTSASFSRSSSCLLSSSASPPSETPTPPTSISSPASSATESSMSKPALASNRLQMRPGCACGKTWDVRRGWNARKHIERCRKPPVTTYSCHLGHRHVTISEHLGHLEVCHVRLGRPPGQRTRRERRKS